MARPDLTDSDLQGLDASYRELCAHRRRPAAEATRVMRQTLQRDNKTSARMRCAERQFAALDNKEANLPTLRWLDEVVAVLIISIFFALGAAAGWIARGWS